MRSRSSCAALQAPGQRAALRGLLVWAAVMQQHSRRAERALPRFLAAQSLEWHRRFTGCLACGPPCAELPRT